MPKILQLKVIDGEVWAQIDMPTGGKSVTLWTLDEQAKNRNDALEDAARLADDHPEVATAIRDSKRAL